MIDNYKLKLRKNHSFLSSAGLVRRICEPLQYFNIHLFTYLKKFDDGSQINLSSNPNWIYDYYDLGLYRTSYYQSGSQETGLSLWPTKSPLAVFRHGRKRYNSVYGFTLCQKQADNHEFFFFSLSSQHYKMLDICINNIDLIEEFTGYFKDRASALLRNCSRIILPNSHYLSQSLDRKEDLLYTSSYIREKFSQSIKVNSLSKWLKNYESLTKREAECLNLLIDYQTIPELAKELNISKRTAETHLERIKSKLQCSSKQELLIKLAHLPSIYR